MQQPKLRWVVENEIVISWYCGYGVGPYKWVYSGDWVHERDECGNSFETTVLLEDFKNESCFAICPKCGAELNQKDDCPVMKE